MMHFLFLALTLSAAGSALSSADWDHEHDVLPRKAHPFFRRGIDLGSRVIKSAFDSRLVTSDPGTNLERRGGCVGKICDLESPSKPLLKPAKTAPSSGGSGGSGGSESRISSMIAEPASRDHSGRSLKSKQASSRNGSPAAGSRSSTPDNLPWQQTMQKTSSAPAVEMETFSKKSRKGSKGSISRGTTQSLELMSMHPGSGSDIFGRDVLDSPALDMDQDVLLLRESNVLQGLPHLVKRGGCTSRECGGSPKGKKAASPNASPRGRGGSPPRGSNSVRFPYREISRVSSIERIPLTSVPSPIEGLHAEIAQQSRAPSPNPHQAQGQGQDQGQGHGQPQSHDQQQGPGSASAATVPSHVIM